ncbi:MAG: NAD-dependent oxidoreductase, partial [Dehalococcoidia bacterium]
MELVGKVVAITGGFGTLGLALGAAAAAQGARVALIDRAAAPEAAKLPGALAGALLVANVDLASFEAA